MLPNQTHGAVGGWPDLVMAKDEARVWYESTVSVEEKVRNPLALHLEARLAQTCINIFLHDDQVDGSNLGISITPDHKLLFQNRSHYVNTETQAQVPCSRRGGRGRPAWRDRIDSGHASGRTSSGN